MFLADLLRLVRDESIAVVQLNRPEALNALSEELLRGIVDSCEALDRDPSIRCIVLAGSDKAFAAGADIKTYLAGATPVSIYQQDLSAVWDRLRRIRTPLIAAVSGYALGGGCELAMACDIIVASESAQFGQPEVNLGLMPGAGATQRLVRAVGKYVANSMILTGRRVGADEGKAIGLVAFVYPQATWLEDAKALARTIASKPPIAVQLATELVDAAQSMPLETGLLYERRVFSLLFATEDEREGVDAFVAKRKPIFRGR